MKICQIRGEDIDSISKLASECFEEDPFYKHLDASLEKRREKLQALFKESIRICKDYGYAYYIKENGEYIAFALWFNYAELKREHIKDYNFIFGRGLENSSFSSALNEETQIIDKLINDCPEYLYLLAVAVRKDYRRKNIASYLVRVMMDTFPDYNFFADISNLSSVSLYEKLGFETIGKNNGCTFVRYLSSQLKMNFKEKVIYIGFPISFDPSAIGIKDKKLERRRFNFLETNDDVIPYFTSSLYSSTEVDIYPITYEELLNYQRLINILFFQEIKYEEAGRLIIIYVACCESFPGFHNYDASSVLHNNKEGRLIPDLFVSIPVKYEDITLLDKLHVAQYPLIRRLLTALKFRTTYEAGIPVKTGNPHDFKNRIERFYLGKVKIQILSECEVSFNGIESECTMLGEPVEVGLIVAIDKNTSCGVLHLVSLTCGLLVTHLLDSVSRNQVNVITENETANLYSYLYDQFKIEKKGSAKNFLTLPYDRAKIDNDILASILFCETLYDEGVALGKIADREILEICKSPVGMAQYNYACVYSYTNVLVQLSESFRGGIEERIIKESITLFYIELVLFEEAAICIANEEIIDFLTDIDKYSPKKVVRYIDHIISEHVKSIDFWNIQMNYPSSKKSIDDIRRSFKIEEIRAILKRNQEQLLMIYNTRSDIVDKAEAILLSTVGTVFTILSVMNFVIEPKNRSLIVITVFIIFFILFVYRRFLLKRLAYGRKYFWHKRFRKYKK